jgi:hypothetical protein
MAGEVMVGASPRSGAATLIKALVRTKERHSGDKAFIEGADIGSRDQCAETEPAQWKLGESLRRWRTLPMGP